MTTPPRLAVSITWSTSGRASFSRRVWRGQVETLRHEHHGLASRQRLDAAHGVRQGAERAFERDVALEAIGQPLAVALPGAGRIERPDPRRPPDALDGRLEQPAIGGELLQRAGAARGPDDRDEIARPELPVDVAVQHGPHVDRAAERHAQVVDDDRHHAAGLLARRQPRPRPAWRAPAQPARPRPRRVRGRGAIRANGVDVRHLADRLALAALDHLEVGGRQVRDVTPLAIGDHRVERREAGPGAEGRLAAGRLRVRRLGAGARGHAGGEQAGGQRERGGRDSKLRISPHQRTSKSTHCDAGRSRPSPDCGATLTCSV